MKILVTGGCGFIASHVADAYIAAGHDVAIVDDLSTGKMANKPEGARFHKVNICDPAVEDIFRMEEPDIVNHHAAQISVPLSVQEPLIDAEVNIKGTIRLLELSRKHGVKRFIFSSTGGAIYGEADVVPTAEDYPPQPASPYAIAKFSAENYIRFYGSQYGMSYTCLRYANVYGPRQIPHGEAGVVAIFTETLLKGRLPTINHFPGEPEGMVRDYCYVKDVASASIMATTGGKTGIFNIGTGRGTRTRELYMRIAEALQEKGIALPDGFKTPPTAEARGGDIRVSTLKVEKAKEELGFEAMHDLASGLSETIDWYLAQNKKQDR
ncbi:MAG: NAD-dependent epimerase/dehydratase family protein [Syntrophorhabdales bacterium]|jgi:UDP-glucose 4-epimerase